MFHKTRWKKFCLRSAPSSNMPDDVQVGIQKIVSKFRPSMHYKAFNEYMSGMQCSGALGRLGRHCRRTQSHHCRPARSTTDTFKLNPFQAFATGMFFPKGIAKEQGHGKTSYKVFSLNPLYQIEEDVGKISFNKSWRINMLVFYARNIYFPQKEHGKGTSKRQRNNMLRLSPFEVEYWKTRK